MPDVAPDQSILSGDGFVLRPRTGAPSVHGFTVEIDGREAGSVELQVCDHRVSTAHVCWQIASDFRGRGLGHRALQLLVEHAFDTLGLRRVETYVDRRHRHAIRSAARAGLRKEGVVRDYAEDADGWYDAVLLSRLATDALPSTREAFTAWLNSSLPTKRAIAQALIRDADGRVLACELVYKKPWDLPGGVVDPFESPAAAVLRELSEELGVSARIRSLAAVSWLPSWRGWDDATLFLFDVEADPAALARATLQPREIRAIHWCDEEQLADHAADYTVRVVREAIAALDAGTGTAYLEDGRPADW
ncbi:NUDIX hydrolase [Flexivirga sp. ID2601S]|uniref:NUDIX hydrolase n=1 Tax=Flexivirga aerilata TaxID=1656889 RepID=A0A849AP88_9MICO|nr:NUDIX hydrolase [Flexivirga aerilata]NNG38602.1 NUDIX hydrolase [Flexivirga aerilata]